MPTDTTPLDPRSARSGPPRLLLAGVVALIAAHLALRAWVAFGAYFYGDDYRLVDEADRAGLTTTALLAPYDAQFMPFGRFLAWVAAQPEPLTWPVLATMTWLMAAAAAISCAWMLVTLFGWRRRVLALLALYLTTAMTVPAFLWWSAALNQLPLQTVFFVAVAAWVRHLRGDGRRWLALTLAVLAFGLGCYVKTLFVFPVLAVVAVGYFAEGGLMRRTVTVLRTQTVAVVVALVGGAGFLLFYLDTAPAITSDERPAGAARLAEEMLGESFLTAVVGGPWQWDDAIAPVGLASPPPVLVQLSWVVVALAIAYITLRRARTGRAWLLLAAYLAGDYALLLTTRAQVVGSVTGAEMRYLTDAMCAVVLAVGLATMELRGAAESSHPRSPALLRWRLPRPLLAATIGLVLISGTVSTIGYARLWHDEHPGKDFFTAAVADLDEASRTDLVDELLDPEVTGAVDADYSHASLFLGLLSTSAAFPDATERLHVLADDGAVLSADVDEVASTVSGPHDLCGWPVRGATTRRLPLARGVIASDWWLRLDYLSSNDTGLDVSIGDVTTTVSLVRGTHRLFLRLAPEAGAFDQIVLSGADPGVTLCVDQIIVGRPRPSEELQ